MGHERFERHAALRAIAGPDLADFRVHGAGVNRCDRRGWMTVIRVFCSAAGVARGVRSLGRLGVITMPMMPMMFLRLVRRVHVNPQRTVPGGSGIRTPVHDRDTL